MGLIKNDNTDNDLVKWLYKMHGARPHAFFRKLHKHFSKFFG